MTKESNRIKQDWEVIVIGTGVGGATIGHTLAKAGKEVLFLEQGRSYLNNPEAKLGAYAEMFFPQVAVPDLKHRSLLEQAGRWTGFLDDNSSGRSKQHIPFIGAGTGGSSAIYGAALERFFPEDFKPRENYPNVGNVDLPPTWPIQYEELLPYYREAESLYGVRGGGDPLREDSEESGLATAPEFGPANQFLADFLTKKGLHPYRLPTACEFLPGCQTCQGFLCARDCKGDSVKACLRPAIEQHGATLMDRCLVTRLEADSKRVTSVVCNHQGSERVFRSEIVILAAGALSTPAILLRSTSPVWPQGLANSSGLVGRYLMRHCIDLYALSPKVKPAPNENTKELAFNDLYFRDGEKLGTVQSFGRLPPSAMLAESVQHDIAQQFGPTASTLFRAIKPAAREMMRRLLKDTLVLATTMEDLPVRENRVTPNGLDGITISYLLNDQTRQRISRFRELMADTLKPLRYTLIKQAENNDRIAHACGTCRMGEEPGSNVIDRNNRAHDLDNLYLVDSSFFPTSAGTNPSLTIAANALRVADHILGK